MGKGLVVTLGPNKLTALVSIKSCIACKGLHNVQYHVPESDYINIAHVDENEEELDLVRHVASGKRSNQHLRAS